MVIFNHKAESPTYIIPMAGIGIWYFSQRPDPLNRVLLILSFLLISMSISDLVPAVVRNGFIRPYGIKAVMAVVVCEQDRAAGVPNLQTIGDAGARDMKKSSSTLQLLRLPFSFFLMPVYWFALVNC